MATTETTPNNATRTEPQTVEEIKAEVATHFRRKVLPRRTEMVRREVGGHVRDRAVGGPSRRSIDAALQRPARGGSPPAPCSAAEGGE
jgi:hypothetical protein